MSLQDQENTNNGSEYHKYFQEYAIKLKIPLYRTYPRTPKMNAKVERVNRIVQEEFYAFRKKPLWNHIKLTESSGIGCYGTILKDFIGV